MEENCNEMDFNFLLYEEMVNFVQIKQQNAVTNYLPCSLVLGFCNTASS